MELNKLSLRDKAVFKRYLSLKSHELSVYSFENIYIWKGLFAIKWKIIQGNLCVFFQDKIGFFMYLPPQAKIIKPEVVAECFRIMDVSNKNKEVSRIENVEEKDIAFFQDAGYLCQQKYPEYLCLRKDLVQLKGDRFKAKRASYNYFIKHYPFKYQEYSSQDKSACLKLYHSWIERRKAVYQDALYQGMLNDSLNCLKILLADYKKLGFSGRVVSTGKEIKAFTPLHPGSRLLYKGDVTGFTFGYRLNNETFCILYEITDLAAKGLAQFIFRKFCAELNQYKYINIMDDSGLENLKKVKLSYHPIRLIPNYIVTRMNG